MIAEVLAAYGSEVAPNKASARNIGYHISNLLKGWGGEKRVADITKKSCEAYAKGRGDAAAAADLKYLRLAVKYWHAEYGPLASIPVFAMPEPGQPKERWLTRSEAASLLWAARRYQHLRRAILLQLYTGSRPGVILAMRWDQIDLKGGTLLRKPVGARQDKKKRAPKVRLGWRITAHLKRWRRLDGDEKVVCHLRSIYRPNTRQVRDPHDSWKRVVKDAGLAGTGVTRHTLRHTRATWMMQAGVPIWEAAGFLGMTVKTLEKVYGHHSPDHQERAANI